MDGEQTTIEPDALVGSGHTGGHMTARSQRIEVITRGERRRRWTIDEKREIVAESHQPGIRPSEVIRKHGIGSSQLYAWRQQLTRRLGSELARPAASFAQVDVVMAQRQEKSAPMAHATTAAVAAAPLIAPSRAEGLIEIVLPGGVPLSTTGAELLFEVFSQRYERASTIVTSNLPFDEWTGVFGSERLTGALLDRLTHHVHMLEMNGDSYRLKQSKQRGRQT